MIERAGIEAKFGFKPHPHMLRHACGYALANREHDTRALQAYLGHKNIQHTVRYTELSPTRFKNFCGISCSISPIQLIHEANFEPAAE
jgi:site-specific recombinase XerD